MQLPQEEIESAKQTLIYSYCARVSSNARSIVCITAYVALPPPPPPTPTAAAAAPPCLQATISLTQPRASGFTWQVVRAVGTGKGGRTECW